MLLHFKAWQLRRRRSKLERDLSLARDAYEAAIKRCDTRDQHNAWLTLRDLRHQLLACEVELSVIRSQRKRSRAKRPSVQMVPQ